MPEFKVKVQLFSNKFEKLVEVLMRNNEFANKNLMVYLNVASGCVQYTFGLQDAMLPP